MEELERLISQVGKATVRKYFNEFEMVVEGDLSRRELRELLDSHEDWSESTITNKINGGVKLVELYEESEVNGLLKVGIGCNHEYKED